MGSSPLAAALRDTDFDEVELVGFDPRGQRSFYTGGSYGVGWSRLLETDERARLRDLIGALPSGVSARCHMPPFGLLFGTPPREVHVSLCFRCNNAYVDRELVAFDAGSPEAQELLAFLRSRIPGGWSSEE
ncbi:MAG: hypothetical protein E6J91_23685 [Deltaproteobacteria bacterium]|nr:MAG: hypothetical protein E6J91_23685 [Deltaproteobacteria bacterium]